MNFGVVTLAFLLLIAADKCQAKNILCLLGIGGETSDNWNKALLKELANRQHDLTIVTSTTWSDDEEFEMPNAEFVHLEKTQRFLEKRYENVSKTDQLEQSNWKFIMHWYDRQLATCRANLESIGFSEALHLAVKEKRKYDLIIYDITYGPGCLLHLAYLFGEIPMVGITSGHLHNQILDMSGQSLLNPATDAYILSDFGTNMSYWKRLHNAALYTFDCLYRKWVLKPVIEGMWSKNMHAKNIHTPTSFDSLMPRFKLILANYQPSLHTLQALPVNVVPVPGLHIQEHREPLGDDLKTFIENTKREVILIDLNMQVIGQENVQKILAVIETFPDNGFVWINGDVKVVGKNKASNLFVASEGEPGQIMAHDKVKCSVINSDILNIQESLYHGVPFITVTTSPEQRYIAQRLLERNLAMNMAVNTFDSSVFQKNILKCLTEKSLQRNVNQLQQSLKDQQNSPLETATWWVEHLLKQPRANDHLWTARKEPLGFIAHHSLDVVLILQIFLVLCVANTIYVMRQTILNLKKSSKKSKKKEAGTMAEVSKKTKKSKTKTS